MDRTKVTSLVNFGLTAEDAGVRLSGKGDFCHVLSDTAKASEQLTGFQARGWVRLDPVRSPVAVWPFVRPADRPPPAAAIIPPPAPPSQEIVSIRQEIARMVSLLETIASRPSGQAGPAASEAVAPIVSYETPVFIPSKVVPDANADIKISEPTIHDKDVSAGVDALKKTRARR